MSTESLVCGSFARMFRASFNHFRNVAASAVIPSSWVLAVESKESSKSGAMYLTVPFNVPACARFAPVSLAPRAPTGQSTHGVLAV